MYFKKSSSIIISRKKNQLYILNFFFIYFNLIICCFVGCCEMMIFNINAYLYLKKKRVNTQSHKANNYLFLNPNNLSLENNTLYQIFTTTTIINMAIIINSN